VTDDIDRKDFRQGDLRSGLRFLIKKSHCSLYGTLTDTLWNGILNEAEPMPRKRTSDMTG